MKSSLTNQIFSAWNIVNEIIWGIELFGHPMYIFWDILNAAEIYRHPVASSWKVCESTWTQPRTQRSRNNAVSQMPSPKYCTCGTQNYEIPYERLRSGREYRTNLPIFGFAHFRKYPDHGQKRLSRFFVSYITLAGIRNCNRIKKKTKIEPKTTMLARYTQKNLLLK